MSVIIRFTLNPKLYIRDPQDTKLGRNLILHSISLIDELGFEQFTFKKLAASSRTTEASVYRYFENKHLLLIYLLCWHWEWLIFQIDMVTMNISNPEMKLKNVIRTLINSPAKKPMIEFIDQTALHRIVVAEGTKAYHTKAVDEENTKGFFLSYKRLTEKISGLILEVSSDFPYPRTLASNLVEMASNHIYFAQHLPRLTDIHIEDNNLDEVASMLEYFAFTLLNNTKG